MEQINFAAIEIGSNAVRLLIKGIYKGETANQLKKTFIVRVPLRLGQDAFTLGRISNDKTERLLRLIAAFKQMMYIESSVTELVQLPPCEMLRTDQKLSVTYPNKPV